MWNIKTFKTREKMLAWIERHGASNQWVEVFVNNGFAVDYKPLRRVYWQGMLAGMAKSAKI